MVDDQFPARTTGPQTSARMTQGANASSTTEFPPSDPALLAISAPPPAGPPRGVWGFWLRATGPSKPFARDAAGRERARRASLISTMLAVILFVMLVILPKGFIPVLDFGTLGGVAICALVLIVAIPLNRAAQVTAAGVVYCVGIAVAIAWSLLATPNGLGLQDLPTYDLFALPVVIAGILLPRRAPFFIWLGCAAFIVGDVTFETHQPNLIAYINEVGLYATIIIPLVLTFVISVVSWLAAGSVERAIIEADRTADLERAYRLIAEQKRRLEGAIAAIQNVHARVANGDFSARASVNTGELMGLGVSLNLMLDRISRLRGSENALNAIEQGAQRLIQYIWELGTGRFDMSPPQTGAALLDGVAASLDQVRRMMFAQASALHAALQPVLHTGEALVGATRALGWRTQELGSRENVLSDALRSMRMTAERAEASLTAPANWLEQAAEAGWADGVGLAQTVGDGLISVRQVIALADQSPVAATPQETALALSERDSFERAARAEREFVEALRHARAMLSRFGGPSSAPGPVSQY